MLGGIYGGVFTATEGAAIGVLLTAVGLRSRELDLRRTARRAAGHRRNVWRDFRHLPRCRHAERCTGAYADAGARRRPYRRPCLPPLACWRLRLIFYIVLGGVMDELSMLLLTLPSSSRR